MDPTEVPIPFSQRSRTEAPAVTLQPIPFSQRGRTTPIALAAPEAPVTQPTMGYAQGIDELIKSYGRPTTKEDFLKDPKLQAAVDEDLRLRSNNGGFVNAATDTAIWAGGGFPVNFVDKLNPEDKFELWQNVHRNFAGGNTTTTLTEARLMSTSDEETRAKLGAGYLLFDSMDNAFTGNGTWGESFDAFRDYARSTLWDPTTVIGLGVGRAYTAGGAKATSLTVKAAANLAFETVLKRELAQGTALQAAKVAAKTAAKEVARKGFLKVGAKVVAVTATPDLVANVGLDALSQSTLIKGGAQDNFSFSETALAAAGSIALPMVVGMAKLSSAGIEKAFSNTKYAKTFSKYREIKNMFAGRSYNQKTALVKQSINLNTVHQNLRSTFDDFNNNMLNYLPWEDAKIVSGQILNVNNTPISADDMTTLFWHTLFFGDKKGGNKGLVESLSDVNFAFVERDPTDNMTNWLGDVLSWMPDNLVSSLITDFETKMGTSLPIGKTAVELSSSYKKTISNAGSLLANSSWAARMLGVKAEKNQGLSRLLKGLATKAKDMEHPPSYLGYVQSVWKRTMTSAAATVALNVKGWKTSVLLNNGADLVNGLLVSPAHAALRGAMGDTLGAKRVLKEGAGTVLGTIKRGYALLNYNDTLDAAQNFLGVFPEVRDILFKNAGDKDAVGSLLKLYNLPETNGFLRGLENSVEATQKITGTLLQDEVTKLFSFITAMEQNIMKEYGMSYNDFITQRGKSAFLEVHKPEFITKVIAPAIDRTTRETFSKNWSDKVGSSPLLKVAKIAEQVSSNSIGGFIIPFGRFFNSSMAMMGDYTMINAIRHVMKRVGGYNVDLAQENGQELLAKGLMGWSTFMYFGEKAMEKIDAGLAWNQERDETTGHIVDKTFDFPDSFFAIGGQIIGHLMKDQEVPEELTKEAVSSIFGQTFRSGQDGIDIMGKFLEASLSANSDEVLSTLKDIMIASSANIISGMTRPLEPINQISMIVSGDYSVPDRRQGYRFVNEAFRYLDKVPELIVMEDNREVRYSSTQGQTKADVGKSVGTRTMPENSPINMMLNSIGTRDWKSIKWDGDPEVKNRLDQLIYPQLNTLAAVLLEKDPDFFNKKLGYRQVRVKEIIEQAKKITQDTLEAGVGKDPGLVLLKELATLPKGNVAKAMDYLGLTETPSDIAAMDGGPEKLKTLIYLAKDWDKIMYDAK